jgi:type VI secretion system secreted protein VgrG
MRLTHGLLAELEEIDRTGLWIFYQFVLVPHFARARYRRRCRNFTNRSLREIVNYVLENRSQAEPGGQAGLAPAAAAITVATIAELPAKFVPPTAYYRWASVNERLDDPSLTPYIVQYNESDFDFVSRLLEAEGISYYFEHGPAGVVLTLTDGQFPVARADENRLVELRRVTRGDGSDHRDFVRALKQPRRLGPRVVTVRDYDYNRSLTELQSSAGDTQHAREIYDYFEFPALDELEPSAPGARRARILHERHDVERLTTEAYADVRALRSGHVYLLVDRDGQLPDQELLIVRSEVFATELTPEGTILDEEPFGFRGQCGEPQAGFDQRFLAVPKDTMFRPALSTARPKIAGIQTARVTAEEVLGERPQVHADPLGRVRLRFAWDQRGDIGDGTPTSDWVRVSQQWAGAGYGGLYTPRVGHEVLVAYLQGDPERPVIVGRVYNAQNVPPYDARKKPTLSTLKSASAEQTREVEGFNELRFEDEARREQIFLHAQRNLDELIRANHTTSVGADQTIGVGGSQETRVEGHQSNVVAGPRDHTVKHDETVHVEGDRHTSFDVNEYHRTKGNRTTNIGVTEILDAKFRETRISKTESLDVGEKRETRIGTEEILTVKGRRTTTVESDEKLDILGKRAVTTKGVDALTAGETTVLADKVTIAAPQEGGATQIWLNGGNVVIDSGAGADIGMHGDQVTWKSALLTMSSPEISLKSAVHVSASSLTIECSGEFTLKATKIVLQSADIDLKP